MQDEELDAHAWSGLEYLESISGPGAIAELVEGYLRDVPDRFSRMKAALESGETETLGRLAHDLKSNSATVGALELSALAAQIEFGALEASREDLTFLLLQMESLLPGVFAALKKRAGRYPGRG
jgi:HPt (histidine-containing phosphotransfer) domain-containing protein